MHRQLFVFEGHRAEFWHVVLTFWCTAVAIFALTAAAATICCVSIHPSAAGCSFRTVAAMIVPNGGSQTFVTFFIAKWRLNARWRVAHGQRGGHFATQCEQRTGAFVLVVQEGDVKRCVVVAKCSLALL
jgi:hypothetical protein